LLAVKRFGLSPTSLHEAWRWGLGGGLRGASVPVVSGVGNDKLKPNITSLCSNPGGEILGVFSADVAATAELESQRGVGTQN